MTGRPDWIFNAQTGYWFHKKTGAVYNSILDVYFNIQEKRAMTHNNELYGSHQVNDVDKSGVKCVDPKAAIGSKKVPLSLVPASALIHTAMAMKSGAKKYGPYNWRTGEKIQLSIYIDAAQRHIAKYFNGQELDEESGFHELGHAMATLAVIIDALEVGQVYDDRPPKADIAGLLEKNKEVIK